MAPAHILTGSMLMNMVSCHGQKNHGMLSWTSCWPLAFFEKIGLRKVKVTIAIEPAKTRSHHGLQVKDLKRVARIVVQCAFTFLEDLLKMVFRLQ